LGRIETSSDLSMVQASALFLWGYKKRYYFFLVTQVIVSAELSFYIKGILK
jgi:hypothetical protein